MAFKACLVLIVSTFVLVVRRCEAFDCLGGTQVSNSLYSVVRNHPNYEQIKAKSEQPANSDDPNLRELVKFYLFTSETKDDQFRLYVGDNVTLSQSKFDKKNPTKFVIHGYINNVNSEAIQDVKNALLTLGNFNVIAVDWGDIAMTIFYHVAAEQTDTVGHYLARFIDFLVDEGVPLTDMHMIGHSLGAHVAGFAGSNITTGKVARISGLDPAKPCFYNSPPDLRLDGSDADFVDCIHTCGGYLGLIEEICYVDFYANGGKETQPGCSILDPGICSHGRAHEYFAESILPNHGFASLKCDKIPTDNLDSCKQSDNLMGYGASPQMPGIFYTATRDASPFSFNVTTYH